MVLSQIGSVMLTIPVILMLVVFVFRLDVLIFRSPAKQVARTGPRRFATYGSDETMTDPDGRVPAPVRGRSNSPYKHL